MSVARRGRWRYALAALPPIVAVVTILLAPGPRGHWTEHLWGAYLEGAQLVLLLVLAAVLGWRTDSLPVALRAVLVLIAVGILYQMVGNYQVASSIWQSAGDQTPVDLGRAGTGISRELMFDRFADYNQGHDRAQTGDLMVVLGGAAFALIVGLKRIVPTTVAALAGVMVIVPPPFLWPGAGVLMLMLYGLTSEKRHAR